MQPKSVEHYGMRQETFEPLRLAIVSLLYWTDHMDRILSMVSPLYWTDHLKTYADLCSRNPRNTTVSCLSVMWGETSKTGVRGCTFRRLALLRERLQPKLAKQACSRHNHMECHRFSHSGFLL
jgi:hypothetical protein